MRERLPAGEKEREGREDMEEFTEDMQIREGKGEEVEQKGRRKGKKKIKRNENI